MCNILLDYNEKGDRSMNSNVEKLEQLYSLLNVIQHMLEMPNSDIFNNDIAILMQLAKNLTIELNENEKELVE